MTVENGQARHTIRDLSKQNAGSQSPLDRPTEPGDDAARAMLRNVEDCYRDGESLRNLHVRPNQVLLTNANRADVFFKAPRDAAGKVYTILAQEFILHTDNFQQRLQVGIARGGSGFSNGNPAPIDVVVGYVRVAGAPVPGGDFDVMSLSDRLPPVPPYLRPVEDDELRVPAAEAAQRRVPSGQFRTRVLSYSGYGTTDFPLIEVPEAFAREHPELKKRLWDEIDGTRVLLAPYSRTMAINGQFDLAGGAAPPVSQKFGHHDPSHPRILVDTSEEWVVYNCSIPLWSHTDTKTFQQPGQYAGHYRSYPLSRVEGQGALRRQSGVPDHDQGRRPPVPHAREPVLGDAHRGAGRTRPAPQRAGAALLDGHRVHSARRPRRVPLALRRLHRDVGEPLPHPHARGSRDDAGCRGRAAGGRDELPAPHARRGGCDVAGRGERDLPEPSRELMYLQSLTFQDGNPELGQDFPGFPLDVPTLVE